MTSINPVGWRHIELVVDRSASMAPRKDETERVVRAFLLEQSHTDGLITVSLTQFNHEVETLFANCELSRVADFTLTPRGDTALLDAVGNTIHRARRFVRSLPKAFRPDEILTVVLTDAEENASEVFNESSIRALIEGQQSKRRPLWTFILLSADETEHALARRIGIPSDAVIRYYHDHIEEFFPSASQIIVPVPQTGHHGSTILCRRLASPPNGGGHPADTEPVHQRQDIPAPLPAQFQDRAEGERLPAWVAGMSSDPLIVDIVRQALKTSSSSWSSNSEEDEDGEAAIVYQLDPDEAAVNVVERLRMAGFDVVARQGESPPEKASLPVLGPSSYIVAELLEPGRAVLREAEEIRSGQWIAPAPCCDRWARLPAPPDTDDDEVEQDGNPVFCNACKILYAVRWQQDIDEGEPSWIASFQVTRTKVATTTADYRKATRGDE
ncbi:hypothetical protein GCM10009733_020810 [Nonomuraea maheshkhaliensis]|uniref:VWA domain-containing protein n=1 Tax=Nonomuraea maheshkhaliensis TaxID=419590 RepID=A0ABP4R116_9ACTN